MSPEKAACQNFKWNGRKSGRLLRAKRLTHVHVEACGRTGAYITYVVHGDFRLYHTSDEHGQLGLFDLLAQAEY